MNDAGQTAFSASLAGSGVSSTNNESIWSEGSGSLALVAREGNQAPGTPSGVTYGGSSPAFSLHVLNDAGQTAFTSFLSGSGVDSTNNQGIWSEGSGSLALVARTGSQAPGVPDGVNFSPFSLSSPVLNDAGQTAFAASLTGSGVDDTNKTGIWATDRTGVLQLIARAGDPLEVAPGDFRTVSTLRFAAGTSDQSRSDGFNNLGQLAFSASFTDGSRGIFVSNRVAVPEPSGTALVASRMVSTTVFRRRRANRRPTPGAGFEMSGFAAL